MALMLTIPLPPNHVPEFVSIRFRRGLHSHSDLTDTPHLVMPACEHDG